MSKKSKTLRALACILSLMMAVALFAACAQPQQPATPAPGAGTATTPPAATTTPGATPPVQEGFHPDNFAPMPAGYTIRILTISHDGSLIAPDHPAISNLQEWTGVNIEMEFVLDANFDEMMNTRLVAGDMPGIATIRANTGPIVSAATSGAFWDLTDYLQHYSQLGTILNPVVMNNISINGRHFGIYRERDIGRNGIVYRSDWAEYLGLGTPETMDDLFNLLEAFTVNNPQPNGGQTYGMTWSVFMGPFNNLAVMHGAPNRWEVVDGEFVPWFESEGFYEAMQFSRRLFEGGIINPDFAALQTGEWHRDFSTSISGVHIDVADEANNAVRRLRENGFLTQEQIDDGEAVWVTGPVTNRSGERRLMATPGHLGYIAITTSGAPTEQDLHYHLQFLNRLQYNDAADTLRWGAEGYNWHMVNGQVQQVPQGDVPDGRGVITGLGQLVMSRYNNSQTVSTPVGARVIEVQSANLAYVIHDPTLPLRSDTWTARSATLNQIIEDAVVNYIMGRIDRAGFEAAIANWYAEGGQDAINEFGAALAAIG